MIILLFQFTVIVTLYPEKKNSVELIKKESLNQVFLIKGFFKCLLLLVFLSLA